MQYFPLHFPLTNIPFWNMLIPMGNNLTIREIVKEKSRARGISLAKLAFELGTNQVYLLNVLHGRKVSRPLIQRIAQALHVPDLPSQYEIYLASRRVENKGNKPTQQKPNPIKEVQHETI
jgi:transcriptional regulator with XRE-family HTH domain